jgi:hypothetical protein
MKKSIFMLIGLGLCVQAYAAVEVCPSVNEIHHGRFRDWQAYNALSGYPASKALIKRFQQDVESFHMAQWSLAFPEGPGQCYYHSDAEIYLVKEAPKPSGTNWTWRFEMASCRAARDECVFSDVQ